VLIEVRMLQLGSLIAGQAPDLDGLYASISLRIIVAIRIMG